MGTIIDAVLFKENRMIPMHELEQLVLDDY